MTTTPETDNLARGNHVVPTEFAQQLEMQRDEARRAFAIATDQCVAAQSALREARDTVHRLRIQRGIARNFAVQMERERNEARRIANEMSESNKVLLAGLHYTRQYLEEVLDKR
jgi:hypothetical protein